MTTRSKRMATTPTNDSFQIEGVDVPIDEDYINTLDLEQCQRFRDLIVIRCNYITHLTKTINKHNINYQNEQTTLLLIIAYYDSRLKSLKNIARNEEKRRKKAKEIQVFQQAKDDYTRTGICYSCFTYREKIGWCLYQCQICGYKDDTSKDSGYM
jgi:hypothetical protein